MLTSYYKKLCTAFKAEKIQFIFSSASRIDSLFLATDARPRLREILCGNIRQQSASLEATASVNYRVCMHLAISIKAPLYIHYNTLLSLLLQGGLQTRISSCCCLEVRSSGRIKVDCNSLSRNLSLKYLTLFAVSFIMVHLPLSQTDTILHKLDMPLSTSGERES